MSNITNLKKILKVTKKRSVDLVMKIEERINELTLPDSHKSPKYDQLCPQFGVSFNSQHGLLDQGQQEPMKNWIMYQDIVSTNLFLYAKQGNFHRFKEAVETYRITVFKRYKVSLQKNQQNQRVNRRDDDGSSSSSSSIASSKQLSRASGKKGERRLMKRDSSSSVGSNMQITSSNGEETLEITLPNLAPDISILKNLEDIAAITPLIVAVLYKNLNIVKYVHEKMEVDMGMSLCLLNSNDENDEILERLFPDQFNQGMHANSDNIIVPEERPF
mmetsp:Transcript_32819/g.50119  ORF Transcript_32819/g.50119 Transcript_32819/m.50119 type:complete len:274 (+) Transcript_32819:1741-2562(+)